MTALPARSSQLQRLSGLVHLGFSGAGGETRLQTLHQKVPCRVLFPRPADGDPVQAVLVTTSGGLTGGDRLNLTLTCADGAQAMVVGQAAEKIYRSLDADVAITVSLVVEPGGWLEYLPQETILFDGARLNRSITADIAPGARLVAGEILVLGRAAHGETFDTGYLREAWRVRRDGRSVWMDAFLLDGDIAALRDRAATLGGAAALGTVLYVADDAATVLDEARGWLSDAQAPGLRTGVTVIGPCLIARFLGAEARAVRLAVGAYWEKLRQRASGLPGRLPQLWYC